MSAGAEWSRVGGAEAAGATAGAGAAAGAGCRGAFSLVRAFVPSFLFVWASLALLALLLFETDWEALRDLKRRPDLRALRTVYYKPLKDYLRTKLLELF